MATRLPLYERSFAGRSGGRYVPSQREQRGQVTTLRELEGRAAAG
jgi:hypothetical protein